jgi:hypothetical protein
LCGDKNSQKYLDLYLSIKQDIDAIIFCFDVTNLRTLENLSKWVKVLGPKGRPDAQALQLGLGHSNEQVLKYLHFNVPSPHSHASRAFRQNSSVVSRYCLSAPRSNPSLTWTV